MENKPIEICLLFQVFDFIIGTTVENPEISEISDFLK